MIKLRLAELEKKIPALFEYGNPENYVINDLGQAYLSSLSEEERGWFKIGRVLFARINANILTATMGGEYILVFPNGETTIGYFCTTSPLEKLSYYNTDEIDGVILVQLQLGYDDLADITVYLPKVPIGEIIKKIRDRVAMDIEAEIASA